MGSKTVLGLTSKQFIMPASSHHRLQRKSTTRLEQLMDTTQLSPVHGIISIDTLP
jgi:hypothetical protein